MVSAALYLLQPPTLLVVLALILTAVAPRWRGLCVLCLVLLVTFSLPILPALLARELAPDLPTTATPPGAIVILSTDRLQETTVDRDLAPDVLVRIWRAAALARREHLPILVAGGAPYAGAEPLAATIARSLSDDFHMPPRWQEDRGQTTLQSAEASARSLHGAGIASIYLLAARQEEQLAAQSFRRFGIEVTPVAARKSVSAIQWPDFIPRAETWQETTLFLHQWVDLGLSALRAGR